MTTASAATNEQGHFSVICMKIGTGGHGDTEEAYTQSYKLRPSMITAFDYSVRTGEFTANGAAKYKPYYKKVARVSTLGQVLKLSYLAHDSLSKLSFVNDKTAVECNDLINGKGVKSGLSIAIGQYEVRIIGGKCQLMNDGNAVRSFREVK
jgi:hypothetical protein